MIVDVIRVASFSEIERVRRLPFPGQVLADEGMDVNPGDIIAEGCMPGDVMILDIAKGLGLSAEDATTCFIREIGDSIEDGDVIAQSEKALPRLFRAPMNGKIIDFQQGQLALATGVSKISIKANMIGTVKSIIPEYGAILVSKGGLIQGIWGNELAGSGILKLVDTSWDEPVEALMLDDLERDDVLACGACLNEEVLDECQAKAISGLIFGRLSPALIPKVLGLPFPVIILQAFGPSLPVTDISELLLSNVGSAVSLNACAVDINKGERPEVIIPQVEGEVERALGFKKELEVGDQVRLISGKAINQVGQVVQLFEREQVFDSGVFFPAALVKLTSMEKVKFPQQNLVVIG